MSLKGGSDRLVLDGVAIVLLFTVAISGGYLPRYLSSDSRKGEGYGRHYFFRLGNMLSAGVMLSAGFCHLLADALPATMKAVHRFPLAPFLCALGYLLTLTADQLATGTSQNREGLHHHGSRSRRSQNPYSPKLLGPDHIPSTGQEVAMTPSNHCSEISVEGDSNNTDVSVSQDVDGKREMGGQVSFLTALVLGCALSLHSVLEGLALGAQQTVKDTGNILIAVAAHKGLAAYALGASLVDSQTTTTRYWKVLIGFSAASPIGIILGFALSEISSSATAASLSALASGTFLYVAMMEVIPKELKQREHIVMKLIVMFSGFTAMSVLAIWA